MRFWTRRRDDRGKPGAGASAASECTGSFRSASVAVASSGSPAAPPSSRLKRSIDGPLKQIIVPPTVLETTVEFLRACGRERYEAVVLWTGVVDIEDRGYVLAELIPRQIGYRGADGVAVSIPGEEITRILMNLPRGEMILCRVHSHPGRAYHSPTDDLNRLLSHVGAISIVVPDFAREPLDLRRCSVNELDAQHRWRELSRAETLERFVING